MIKGEGRFCRQRGKGFVAHITLEIDPDARDYYCRFECSGKGWVAQGYIEEVTATGYTEWKAGAEIGAKFALKIAQKEHHGAIIKKIEGAITDTNPTIVGVASAFAVWNALNFKPPEEVIGKITQIALNSWDMPNPHTQLPDFDK